MTVVTPFGVVSVDDDDADFVVGVTLSVRSSGRVYAYIAGKSRPLHLLIAERVAEIRDAPFPGLLCFYDGNPFNCQRDNLASWSRTLYQKEVARALELEAIDASGESSIRGA